MSIRTRLILIFSICLLLASGSISLAIFFSARQSSQEDFHALATSQLERVEEHIKTFMEPGAMCARYLANLDVVKNSRGKLTSYLDTTETTTLLYANHPLYEQRIYDEFIRVHNVNDNFGLVFMANDDGQYAQAPEGHIKTPGYDPRKRSWYREVMSDPHEVTITSPYLTTGGGMVCSIMVKTRDLQEKPLGLLGVDYSLESMTKDLDARRILKTGYLVVFDASGRIITDGLHPEYVAMEPSEYPALRRRIAAAVDTTFTGVGSRGIEEYVVTRTMSMTGWKLAVIFEYSELMASSYRLLHILVVASAVVLLIAFAIIAFFARKIVHPITELIEASAIISGGEYETSEAVRARLHEKLSVTGQGESRKLSEALNSMLETLQERIEAALAASRAKSDFLSNMSHEMRTPMNAIIGMTAIAKTSDSAEKKIYCLNRIEEASAHLLGVINDILDMSKIEANKLELSPTRFDFEKMLQKVLNMNSYRLREKRQSFTMHIDENIPRELIGDEQRVAQILTNLLSNAVKFTPETGSIHLNAKLLEEENGVCTVQVEVTDTGIGIDEEQQSRLFNSFEQADSSISRRFGGTGLGLPISKRIVELMGGRLWVKSEPGKGSTFAFTIRLERATEKLEELSSPDVNKAQTDAGLFEGCRILLAEDVEINREIVLTLLEPTFLAIDCVVNGAEALKRYCEAPERYDMIFMDLQMPEMDGYEATRRIRALDFDMAKKIPIVAMTANVFREDIEKCLAAGMNDHVGKPLDCDELLIKLRKYLPQKHK